MGDINVRRRVASHFEHGVDFALIVHKSPFVADNKDPMVLSNYIFKLLEVDPGLLDFRSSCIRMMWIPSWSPSLRMPRRVRGRR